MHDYLKKKVRISPVVAAGALLISLAVGSGLSEAGSSHGRSRVDTAILICSTSGVDAITVQNYGGSAGAPNIVVGTSCADALALLLSQKFETKSVHPGDLRGGFYYLER